MRADVVGTAALTDDEAHKIRTFVDRHASEHQAFQHINVGELIKAAPQIYCILPHASPYREEDGRYTRMRFSCAGFAFEAYRKARIELFDADELPMIDFDVIRSGYPAQMRLIDGGHISPDALGLEGNGPWPVMLCGYLFHALNRDAEVIRRELHTPIEDERYFL